MRQASSPFPRLLSAHIHILILLGILLIIGLLTFRDYGLSWDEPLFYDYGKASQYAYSISARLDGTFNLDNSFGASASDHVTRGPAYLLLGGLVEGLFEKAGLDQASAWHLTNFLTYLVGMVFFYLLARIWLNPLTATISVAFFATQPVFWNHAFINPKDSPFSTFFLITMYFGIKMVEKWDGNKKKILISTFLPGILLGFTSAIRFLGPYAALFDHFSFPLKIKWEIELVGIHILWNCCIRHHGGIVAFSLDKSNPAIHCRFKGDVHCHTQFKNPVHGYGISCLRTSPAISSCPINHHTQ